MAAPRAAVFAVLAVSTDGFQLLGARPSDMPRASTVCSSASQPAAPKATVIFLRHGQSVWNEASLFAGWADVELTTLGKNEAASAATRMSHSASTAPARANSRAS